MTQAKVWLVTAGEYSAYRIVAAFVTKELAEEYARHTSGSYGNGEADVEEWDLRDTLPALHDWLCLRTHIFEDGSTRAELERVEQRWADQKYPVAAAPRIGIDATGRAYDWHGIPRNVGVETEGVDHERVRKVHGEAHAIAKARLGELLVGQPDDTSEYPARVNYRLGHELNAELRKAVPWRVLLEADGYGMVETLLEQAGVAHEEAQRLAVSQLEAGGGDEQAAAVAAAVIDAVLGRGDAS